MKLKNKIITSIALLSTLAIIQTTTTSNSGGAGGNTVNGCGAVGSCHGVQSNLTSLSLTGIPSNGYVTGQTYTLTATVTNTNKVAAGFDIATNIGTFTATTGTAISGTDITHTAPKAMVSGVATWDITWTAPTNSATAVTFIFAGNAINSNTTTSGDAWAKLPFTFASAQTFVLPTIANISTTNITTISAKANADMNANNITTNATLEYGTTTAYGTVVNATPNSINGNSNTNVSYTFTSLTPNTLYHYRFIATNQDTTIYSADQTFTTLQPNSIKNIAEIGVSIYPNPTTDFLNISGNKISEYQMHIYDAFGKKQNIILQKNNLDYKINIASFSNGIYILVLQKNGESYTQLFSKN
jgi:Secretion system C-terminal sorting domain